MTITARVRIRGQKLKEKGEENKNGEEKSNF